MCIRDRGELPRFLRNNTSEYAYLFSMVMAGIADSEDHERCLLYTSDAADERSSVDLGGRRIIKKKNRKRNNKKKKKTHDDTMSSTSNPQNAIEHR